MSQAILSNIRICGIASAVPQRTVEPDDYFASFGEAETRKIVQSTGVLRRHATTTLCTSDLTFAAAKKLLADLQWDPSTIEALIFVSQTPDYLLPATSCVLHERLGLSKNCAALDINLGCSGYTYGLWTVANMMKGSQLKRALLLVGDTSSRTVSPLDRATALLFGDAGTATALELTNSADALHAVWGSDGSGHQHIIQPAGMFRHPSNESTALRSPREGVNIRSEEDTYMNGAEVFNFTLREVPKLVQGVLDLAQLTSDQVEGFVFHQANLFMLNHLAKKMKIAPGQLPLSIGEYGNTSSASIPLSLTVAMPQLREKACQLVLVGFGVGLSWSAIAVKCGPLLLPPVIEVPEL